MRQSKIILFFLIFILIFSLSASGWLIFDYFADLSGWVLEDGQYQCLDRRGKPLTGWQNLDSGTYYFHENGTMATGWQAAADHRYYFGTDGLMVTGWRELDGSRYFFDEDGALHQGLLRSGDFLYYMGPDGTPLTGWISTDDGTRFFREDGTAATGLTVLQNSLYFFAEDGNLKTGWQNLGAGRVYFGNTGLQTGWQTIDGRLYYLGNTGAVFTGWMQDGEYAYYLTKSGPAATGVWALDGDIHFFTPEGVEIILVNDQYAIPKDYRPTLVNIIDWHLICEEARPHLEEMLADCAAAGNDVSINSTYRTMAQQQEILDKRTQEYADKGIANSYAKARETVALPGHSEHNMGLAADLVGTEANRWLAENCWKYGFIIRYPEGKSEITGIIYEPWHYRYVGTRVSQNMKNSGLCLEEYVGASALQ